MTRPADLAKLSPEREAEAVRAMAQRELDRSRDAAFMPPISILAAVGAYVYNENAAEALAALRDAGFIVLHEDDVTVEAGVSQKVWGREFVACDSPEHAIACAASWGRGVAITRLVTPWREVSE